MAHIQLFLGALEDFDKDNVARVTDAKPKTADNDGAEGGAEVWNEEFIMYVLHFIWDVHPFDRLIINDNVLGNKQNCLKNVCHQHLEV